MSVLIRYLLCLFGICSTISIASAAERNVVLIITDDQSPTLGSYGDPVARSPHLDRLAAEGVRFTHAYATTASCSASRSAVLSGLFNHRNGQYGHTHDEHHFESFGDIQPLTLPIALARAGYRTGHIGKFHVAPEETYQFQNYFTADERDPTAMAEAVEGFLSDHSAQPFFLYFAPGDPHRSGAFASSQAGAFPPNLFGNRESDENDLPNLDEIVVPEFLPDTIETRSELAQYYRSCARIDRGVGALIETLKRLGLYESTLVIFTSDHGMAFPGAKTTVNEAGLSVPLIVRDPYRESNGVKCDALVSLVDLTPTILDFAGALDRENNRPAGWTPPSIRTEDPTGLKPNSGYGLYDSYHGRSWMPLLDGTDGEIQSELFASHTFHEIQMYYPMRAVWDREYKLIWNIAYPLPFPMASDLWASATWQGQLRHGGDAPFGNTTIDGFLHRPEFELYDLTESRIEKRNLADDPQFAEVLKRYQSILRQWQDETGDPWVSKWMHE